MAKHRFNPHQLSFSFEQTPLPTTAADPGSLAILHGELPPAAPSHAEALRSTTPAVAEPAASAPSDPSDITWTSPDGTDGVPVPRPLTHAVRRGVFGTDEHGEPVDPSPDEVLEITLDQGERLRELLESVRHIEGLLAGPGTQNRSQLLREKDAKWSQARAMVALYAEDFGETAARHFESWAARLGEFEASDPPTKSGGDIANAAPKETPDTAKPESPSTAAKATPTRTRPKKRATAGTAKVEQLHDDVDRALDTLAASLEAGRSDTLKAWLTTMSRFHDYSLNNQMLIAFQRPDATHVAGFHAWKKLNRLVNKGEKGIMILAPVTRPIAKVEEKNERGETKERTVRKIVNTKAVYVFDISQTHGEPLPEFAKVTGDPGGHLSPLKEFIASKAIELYYADRLRGGAQGISEGGRIGCKKGLTAAEEFRTLVHETAHELLHRGERREQTTQRSRELEAEAVAFVVCTGIGLDARECSADYIQLFRGKKKMLVESLQFIREVSREILNHLLNLTPGTFEL